MPESCRNLRFRSLILRSESTSFSRPTWIADLSLRPNCGPSRQRADKNGALVMHTLS
ncbi:hypothetical protein THIOKS11400013 [Thiocapsa sp. KS1]|nr:hypothetical protein THIOKS11400013 [Thiocapsa sp. KS1]